MEAASAAEALSLRVDLTVFPDASTTESVSGVSAARTQMDTSPSTFGTYDTSTFFAGASVKASGEPAATSCGAAS